MDATARTLLEQFLPERLARFRRASGLPVAFGGATRTVGAERQLVISRLTGTLGHSLRGLAVPAGRGLGGHVLRHGVPERVNDYGSARGITHDYDPIVVTEERITSIVAVPVIVRGEVGGVLYGAVRAPAPIGDRALRAAGVVARHLQRDIEERLSLPDGPGPDSAREQALTELAGIIAETTDTVLRDRLRRVHENLSRAARTGPAGGPHLTPRELDALRLVEKGATNLEIGAELGLSPETVKAYLRTAMRKLDARTRAAAVHAARRAGAL